MSSDLLSLSQCGSFEVHQILTIFIYFTLQVWDLEKSKLKNPFPLETVGLNNFLLQKNVFLPLYSKYGSEKSVFQKKW